MFCPIDAEDLPPVHIEDYDVIRETRTSLDTADECSIRDVSDGVSAQDRRPLSTFWTGETSFPQSQSVWSWSLGDQRSAGTSADDYASRSYFPYERFNMTKKQQSQAIAFQEMIDIARERRRKGSSAAVAERQF